MVKIKEAIVVEGVYDKIKLSSYVDAIIFETGGFSLFSHPEKTETLKTLATTTGIVILTDSDRAGFKIRHYIKNKIKNGIVLDAYIPDIEGKEKRKRVGGAEGLLGVEGMSGEIIINALKEAGCTVDGKSETKNSVITTVDLFNLGLSGGKNSKEKREIILHKYNLPSKMSTKLMCEILSRITTLDELKKMID